MKKLISLITFVFCVFYLMAQDDFYRSASNQFYWKNRKPFEGYWQQDVHYKIKASIDDKTDIVDGEEELTYYNNSPDTLSFVYFHLYQNAFVKGSYLEKLNLVNNYKQKFGKYEMEGKGTEILDLIVTKCNGTDAIANQFRGTRPIEFIDNTIMKVLLPCNLNPNNSITIKIKFKTYFDGGGDQRRRMQVLKDNWGNKQFKGVHWYPRICVYDRKFGWETDQHLGKEFYGDFGWYDVELTFPNNYVMDATGILQNKSEVLPYELREKLDVRNFVNKPLNSAPDSTIIIKNGTTKTWKFHADNVHDFAWVADPTFRIGEAEWNGVTCISLSQEPHSSKWQDAAKFTAKIIETYSTDIGMYAYPKMIVADASDGMEYPMLTLDGGLSPGYYFVFAHEIGHNWFFGMVGNNETYRAALDEGFTQFLSNWSLTKIFGEIQPTKKIPYPTSRMDQTVYAGYLRDVMNGDDMQLNTHSDDFNSALNHGGGYGLVYYKTATMLYNLQYVLGDELFLKAMQHYFDQWKICHPYFEDFRASIMNYTHTDLNWFFDQWLETTKHIDYSIIGVEEVGKGDKSPGRTSYKIGFSRNAEMQMPIDFTVYTKDSSFKFYIPNTYFQKRTDAAVLPMWKGWGKLNQTYEASVSVPGKIKDVKIDPTYRLADAYLLDNSWKTPVKCSFDNLRSTPVDRKYYELKWRPDIWYNSLDGLKFGLNTNGNYMKQRDVFNVSVWYNSMLLKDYSGNNLNLMNFDLSYSPGINKKYRFIERLGFIDGLYFGKIGIERELKKSRMAIYFKGMRRSYQTDIDYLLYPAQWNTNKGNGTINIDLTSPYSYASGYGELKEQLRGSFLSDYGYSTVSLAWINHQNISKFELHTRLFLSSTYGNDPAPESMLNLAGGNNEDMMENAFTRSRGFVPVKWLGYGDNYNHFHFAGGLNIRGYAGYMVPVSYNNAQYYLYSGTTGASFNTELDFDKFIPFHPAMLSKYFHVDLYLFGDAGYIENKYNAGTNGFAESTILNTGFLASAGNGVAFTIKRWGKFDNIKPLTLRCDMPWFLSNAPYVDGENFRFRWIVGLSRSF